MFPVLKIVERPMCGVEVISHAAMICCKEIAEAIAAFPAKPSDTVEFAWWGRHHPDLD